MRNRNDISVLEVDFTLLKFTKVPSYRYVYKTCRYLILALDVALFLLKAIGGIENDVNTNSKGWIKQIYQISYIYQVIRFRCHMCHVHNIYNISGEYIRLAYRSINPRPLRDVSGDVALVTGAGGIE